MLLIIVLYSYYSGVNSVLCVVGKYMNDTVLTLKETYTHLHHH